MKTGSVLALVLALSVLSSAHAWNPTPTYSECARVAKYTSNFASAKQFERWARRYHLMDIVSGHVEVHTRLRRCGELGYAAAQDLVRLSPGRLKALYQQAVIQVPDYRLTMSYAYNRGGEQTPSLALQWRSGARVNTVARYYMGTEQDRDPTGQRIYGAADAVAGDLLGIQVSGTLAFIFGSAEWEDDAYIYSFDLSSAANVRRLAGEPVELLVRNSHGKLGTRDFSFASFR